MTKKRKSDVEPSLDGFASSTKTWFLLGVTVLFAAAQIIEVVSQVLAAFQSIEGDEKKTDAS